MAAHYSIRNFVFPILLCLLSTACGHALTAPSTVPDPIVPSTTKALALSGQSNAVNVQPFLVALAPDVVGVSQASTPIKAWAVGQPLWTALEPTLHQPLAAFVWWQGESDEDDVSGYEAALDDLFTRVRKASNQPKLTVILCGANADPINGSLLWVQQRYVREHDHVVYVPSNDLPMLGLSQHLTDDGYRTMAQRIIAAVP